MILYKLQTDFEFHLKNKSWLKEKFFLLHTFDIKGKTIPKKSKGPLS